MGQCYPTRLVRGNTVQLWKKWDSIFALDENCIKSLSIFLDLQNKRKKKTKLLETFCGNTAERHSQRKHYYKRADLTKYKGEERGNGTVSS